jgi:hypothetical protein
MLLGLDVNFIGRWLHATISGSRDHDRDPNRDGHHHGAANASDGRPRDKRNLAKSKQKTPIPTAK